VSGAGLRHRAALLLTLLLAGGCSVQMAYNNLDRLARWSMSDYVDMDDRQRAYFDGAIDQLWTWHRHEHLPLYADYLDDLGPRLADGTDEAQMQALVEQILIWGEDVETRAMPVAVELLASLSDAQVDHLAQAMEEGNVEMAESELDVAPARIRRQWQKEFADGFTQFSGRLTSVQTAYLEQRSADYVPERVMWADYRRRWQGDFLALLRFRSDPEGLARGLKQLSDHRELYFSPELAAADRSNIALLRETSVWLINSFTDRQRQRFVDELAELAEDFRVLAQQEGAPLQGAPCLLAC
jgi:hypothetical protein